MKRLTAAVFLLGLLAISCGGSDDGGEDLAAVSGPAQTCLVGDTECLDGADGGAAAPLPGAIALTDPDGDTPLQISFGGFLYSDGETSQLCSALAESFPPQCGSVVIDIEAPIEIVLEHVAESFGNPEDAKINIEQGIYWTEDWINLSGTLQANRLVLE